MYLGKLISSSISRGSMPKRYAIRTIREYPAVPQANVMPRMTASAAEKEFRNRLCRRIRIRNEISMAETTVTGKKPGQTFVGFAAETEKVLEHAGKKLEKKNLDLIVANDVTAPGAGFDVDTNIVTLIARDRQQELPLASKREVADAILDEILRLRA